MSRRASSLKSRLVNEANGNTLESLADAGVKADKRTDEQTDLRGDWAMLLADESGADVCARTELGSPEWLDSAAKEYTFWP